MPWELVFDTSYVCPSNTVLPTVPPLMPKVSLASAMELLATKVPLVAVKLSNTTVSASVGPVTAFNDGGGGGGGGGCITTISGGTEIVGIGGSEFIVGRVSVWIKL